MLLYCSNAFKCARIRSNGRVYPRGYQVNVDIVTLLLLLLAAYAVAVAHLSYSRHVTVPRKYIQRAVDTEAEVDGILRRINSLNQSFIRLSRDTVSDNDSQKRPVGDDYSFAGGPTAAGNVRTLAELEILAESDPNAAVAAAIAMSKTNKGVRKNGRAALLAAGAVPGGGAPVAVDPGPAGG